MTEIQLPQYILTDMASVHQLLLLWPVRLQLSLQHTLHVQILPLPRGVALPKQDGRLLLHVRLRRPLSHGELNSIRLVLTELE